MENKKIRITAQQSIVVTPDLKIIDFTDKNSMNPNKLRAVVDYSVDKPVKIIVGTHEYDAKIKTWKTVQALVKAGILSIMDVVEEPKKEVKVETKVEKKENSSSKLKLEE